MLFSLQSLTGDPPGTPCESKHAAAARAIGMSDVDVRACLAHPHALGTIMHTSAAEAMRCGAAGVAHDVSLYSEPDAFGFETSALPVARSSSSTMAPKTTTCPFRTASTGMTTLPARDSLWPKGRAT